MDFQIVGQVRIDLDNVDAYGITDISLNNFRISIYRKGVQEPIHLSFITKEERDNIVKEFDERQDCKVINLLKERT